MSSEPPAAGIRFRLAPLPDKDRSFIQRLSDYPRERDLLTDVARWVGSWLVVVLVRLQYRIEVVGRLPELPRVALAANHQSHLDALAVLAVLPGHRRREVGALAATDYFFGSHAVRRVAAGVFAAAVSFDRTRRSELRSWSRRLAEIPRGTILFFPSGSRRRTEAQRGLLVVMARSGWPIVPVRIEGTARAWPVGRWWWTPFRRLRITFGDPIGEERAGELAEILEAFWKTGEAA